MPHVLLALHTPALCGPLLDVVVDNGGVATVVALLTVKTLLSP